jgi:ATP-dependent DNA helicase DinG
VAAPLPLPALHATHAGIWIAGRGEEPREASRGDAIARAAETPHIILNAPLVGQRLGYPELSGLDLLELFAFVHPARFAVPTLAGLSRAVGVAPPDVEAASVQALRAIAGALLDVLEEPDWLEREGAWTVSQSL